MPTTNVFKPFSMFFISILSLWFVSCQADTDLYEELSKYEEEEIDIENGEWKPTEEDNSTQETDFIVDENSYFVTSNATGNQDGESEENAWTWAEAIKNARPGMNIYVKAGLYENNLHTINTSGQQGQPIKFIGYKDVPGDINVTSQSLLGTETRGRRGTTMLANNTPLPVGDKVDAKESPIFYKAYVRNESAIILNASYVEFHNIGFSGYDTAIRTTENSINSIISNCIFHEQGNLDIGMRDTSNPDRWRGTGVDNRESINLTVEYCTFLNVEQNAIQFLGVTNGKVENNLVYSYNQNNGTDYMFLISKNGDESSSNLELAYNTAQRVAGVAHGGHGFVVKNGGNNNVVRNFAALNTSVEVNFTNVYQNTFKNGNISGAFYQNKDALSGIFFGNGAHHNTFENIIIDGSWGGISCSSFPDGASNDNNINANSPGHDNLFVNIVVKNSQYGVIMSEFYAESSEPLRNNIILNSTFFNVEYAIRANRPNSGTKFYNTTFTITQSFLTENNGFSLNTDTLFDHCHFYGSINSNELNSYETHALLFTSPNFINTANLNDFDVSGLQLSNESPLLGAGKDISSLSNAVSKDFNGKTRTTFNIGAF